MIWKFKTLYIILDLMIGSVNVGSLRGKDGEAVDMAVKKQNKNHLSSTSIYKLRYV